MPNDTPVRHPNFGWRHLTRPNDCHAVIRQKAGEPWIYFLDASGETIGYFHPDEVDGVIDALKASMAQLQR